MRTSFLLRLRPRLVELTLAASVALGGCTGVLGANHAADEDGASDADVPVACAASPLPLAHLTRDQYDRTVVDLLALDPGGARPSSGFPADDAVEGFSLGLTVSPLLVEKLQAAAEALAARALEHPERIVPCTTEDDACARAFVQAFGARAFRRPITAAEESALLDVYRAAREDGARPFLEGVGLVIEAALSSPQFLYHWPDDGGAAPGSVVALGDHELASRLSYFLWGTMPDDALFAAAAGGRLRTPEDVEAEARRMLEDPRARATTAAFFRELLGVDDIGAINRDPGVFPEFSAELAQDLQASLEAFLDDAVWSGGTYDDLFTSRRAFMNARLASFYGIDGGLGDELSPVELDAGTRLGLLTQPALLAKLGKFDQSDPIRRGVFLREKILCQELAPPPPDVEFNVPTPAAEPAKTTRERFAAHTSQPSCQNCHQFIDPLGFALETYDALGRYRATENGAPIDATGEILGTEDADGEVDGGVELAERLASSVDARACFVEHWFRYAVRRGGSEGDACELESLGDAFEEEGGDIRALLVRIVKSEAFRTRRVAEIAGDTGGEL
ncbi:DUF1592 domain-containing protein [Sorangium sp. So ce1182]|uniref:DUF1592 domain-containing protein n=1 Tax=Sorangium sp. So ce1182 TaxID=3133334 RepID=UPI003F63B08E